jgi:hypothetical protein
MSELFVFRCPLHISQFNVYRETYYTRTLQDLCVIANLWLCIKSCGLFYWYFRREKIDGLIVAYTRPDIYC